jgi:hypothetical protein
MTYTTDETIGIDQAPKLMAEAVTLLISLATSDGVMFDPSSTDTASTVVDRAAATHQAAFDQLHNNGLLRFQGGSEYVLTLAGFNAADAYITLINEKPD